MPVRPASARSGRPAAPKRGRDAAARRRARPSAPSRSSRPRAPGGAPGSRAEPPMAVSGVLRRLGRAVAAGDLPSVSACFAYPALLLTGAETHEFRDPLQVETVFREGLQANAEAGITALTPRFEHVADLGHGVFACGVRWEETGERAHVIVQESAVGTALVRLIVASGGG